MFPSLQSLTNVNISITLPIFQSLEKYRALRKLQIASPITVHSAMHYLASLRNLSDLCISLADADLVDFSGPQLEFQTLRCLEIRGVSNLGASHFLGVAIFPPQSRQFCVKGISLTSRLPPFQRSLTALQRPETNSLQEVHLHSGGLAGFDDRRARYMDFVHPLLQLPQLSHVRLDYLGSGIPLTDADSKDMTRAWARLTQLAIVGSLYTRSTVSITASTPRIRSPLFRALWAVFLAYIVCAAYCSQVCLCAHQSFHTTCTFKFSADWTSIACFRISRSASKAIHAMEPCWVLEASLLDCSLRGAMGEMWSCRRLVCAFPFCDDVPCTHHLPLSISLTWDSPSSPCSRHGCAFNWSAPQHSR